MADEPRPFVINVKRRWLLLVLPILATLYFAAVVTLRVLDYRIKGVTTDMLVLGGLGFFVFVMLVELPFFLRRARPRAPRRARVETPPTEDQPPMAAPMMAVRGDDELLTTEESQQGLRVLEYSAPAKSRHQNTVYTKTYVPVTGAHVLRIETAVADAADI